MLSKETFAERLRRLIDYKKISQKDLVEATNFNKGQVSNWLSANVKSPRRTTVRQLAEFFNCDIEWLATGKGEPFPKPKPNQEKVEHTGEFERRKTDKAMNEKLAKMEKAVFKTQCPGYFDRFFDFVAEEYGTTREGAEQFLEELCKDSKKYQRWDSDKKRAEEENAADTQKYA